MTAQARSIPFSAPMVRALLETPPRKSQTRRLCNPQPKWVFDGKPLAPKTVKVVRNRKVVELTEHEDDPNLKFCQPIRCPYGVPGDLLYAKEGWGVRTRIGDHFDVVYRADGADSEGREVQLPDWDGPEFEQAMRAMNHAWRPSRFMSRWAARIWLEIVEVRCQRLQEISEEDAKAEGVEPLDWPTLDPAQAVIGHPEKTHASHPYTLAFAVAWDRLNADRALWSSNPWVWAITFKPAPAPVQPDTTESTP